MARPALLPVGASLANQDISLTNFDPNLAALQRQQRLAEMLTQQSAAPIDINSGGGVQAAISPLAVLTKAFQGYAGSYLDKKALKDAGDLQASRRADLAKMLLQQFQTPGTPAQGVQMPGIAPVQTQIGGQPLTVGGAAPDPSQGAAGDGTAPRPTTPQEQMANALAMTGSGNPMAAEMGQQLYAQAANRQMGRDDKAWENAQPMSTAAGQQIAAQGQQAQQNARFQNQLPLTADQRATNALGYAQLNKPMAVPFGGQLYDPRTRSVFTPAGGMGGMNTPSPVDPSSNSLLSQTGLSQAGFDYLTSGRLPRGQALAATTQKEVSDWGRKNNVDTSTMQSTYKANNNVLQSNITRNNQSKILENEIQGTVQSIIPLANGIGQGQISAANLANVWSGKQVNDPNVQQYRDQLLRLRSELAGFNAIAAGKLTEHGQARVDQSDLDEAAQLISSGMNAGGASGLAQSVAMTANKNNKVLQSAVDDATQSVWNQFGVGKNFKRRSQPPSTAGNPGGQPPDGIPQGWTVRVK